MGLFGLKIWVYLALKIWVYIIGKLVCLFKNKNKNKNKNKK